MNPSADYQLGTLDSLPSPQNRDVLIILTCSRCQPVFEGQPITCTPGNILVIKGGSLTLTPGEEIQALLLKEHFFDSLFFAQIMDCPLFYDFLRTSSGSARLLHFDCFVTDACWTMGQILFFEASKEFYTLKTVHAACTLLFTNLHEIHRERLLIGRSTMMMEHKIGRVLTFMSDHYRDITLESTAEAFHYHPAYFSSWFKKHTHITFRRQLLKIRLEQARFLLKETTLPVQTIIEEVGFQEKSHFHRCFKKECGMTPLAYRRQSDHTQDE